MRFVPSITCGVLLAAVALVRAEPPPNVEEAERLFDEGRTLANAGKWAEACDRFSKALAIDRTSGTEINLANCQEQLGHLRDAWGMYIASASDSETEGNTKRTVLARERAANLEPKMVSIVVKVAQPSIRGLVITISGRSTPPAAEIHEHADPGKIDVIATAPNLPHFKKTEVGVAGATVVVEVPVLDASLAEQKPKPIVVGGGGRDSRVHLAYGLAAVGGASAITAVALTFVARNHYNEVADGLNCAHITGGGIRCNPTGTAGIKDAQRLADIGSLFAIGSAALVGAAAIIYFTAPHDSVTIAPTATAQSVGISVGGSF